MSGIDVTDYVEGQEPVLQDPTAPTEEVDRDFMDKLARVLTTFEEALDAGKADLSLNDLRAWLDARGSALDELDDPQLAEWLKYMRESSRCRYRRFSVRG